jgi:hypothetical protein
MAVWVEEGSRGLAHVAMDDFPTVADAIFEIADNPLDYRRGRKLEIDIWINKEDGQIIVEDRGGEGMDSEGVADWLKWGTGHPHVAGDIGRYHKGGKAACGYLADSVEILTRRSGQSEIWQFLDSHWKSRTEWATYGEPAPYTGPIPDHLRRLPAGTGFTRLVLTDLEDRRYNLDRLRWVIGSTYRKLIVDGAVVFRLNGKPVAPLALPESTAFKRRQLNIKLPSGRTIRGWVARLDRDAIKSGPHRIQGGMRLLYQGRLITDGQYFGHHAEGKGLLQSLVGEVELNHVPPLSNKTGFKQGLPEWEEAHQALHDYLAPIIAEFRRAADEQPVSREERKRVAHVQRQLAQALKELKSNPGAGAGRQNIDAGSAGRRPPGSGDGNGPDQRSDQATRRNRARTEAPPDAVGTLHRLRSRLRHGADVPPIEIQRLDPTLRSEALRAGDTIRKIIINGAYPLYRELRGHEAYLAETALLELLLPADEEKIHAQEYIGQVNECLVAWSRVADTAADEAA